MSGAVFDGCCCWAAGCAATPFLFSLPSPALEVSRPIVHLLGFRASPKIPTSYVCLRQAPKRSFKTIGFSFKMVGFSFKMVGFSFKMVGFSFKMADFSFKGSILKDFGQNPSRLQGGTLPQKRPSKTKNDLKRWFLRARGGRARGGLSPLRFRVLPFLSRKVLWTHSLCERGSTPPIGAKPCSCTCRAGPRGLKGPFS